ncbi:MAG TPA: exodeoxyribonuclease VII small subunit [Rhodospirillaceae bacterium]|nr:exodeoxyribonuclease VII small subunit [Candidatus Neomarinimicrobiota bacterium]HCX14255.1 exodeoxyribonuclease VII small subunit [Rhodospirillaceae bacterium]|tara:strand:+ start:889 stop:1131 length:243 start_codon:yes stop_codon:yes gene_type:complete
MAKLPNPKDTPDMGFEEAMKELEGIVRDLEGGNVKLDDAVKFYERGAALKRHCESKLADARNKIEKITGDGKSLDPMDRE